MEKGEELGVVLWLHAIANTFNVWVKEGSGAYFTLEDRHVLLILLLVIIYFLFYEVRAVGHVLPRELLYQVRDKHRHYVSELDFVEFIYREVVVTLLFELLLSYTV